MLFGLRNNLPGLRHPRAARACALVSVLLCLTLAAAPAHPLGASTDAGRLFGYVGWDREYFYFAAKVQDESVVGTNDRPFSEPWDDDSVELCFDMLGLGGEAPHPASARLALSAAGGFTALVGTADGAWRAEQTWAMGLRFDAAVEGTLNKTRDRDTGYLVEVAIPWRFLGGTPRPGSEIGFNVACHLRGEQDGFASWSPAAVVPSDLDRPSTWGRVVFESQARPVVVEAARVLCPWQARGPKVDGKLLPVEWMSASVLSVALPKAPPPVAVREAPRSMHAIALYFHAVPLARTALAQPRDGLGPWWRSDSVAWHRRQAREARLAGIDTLAVAYSGRREEPGVRRSLACLVQALKDLKAEGYTYPLLAVFLERPPGASWSSAQVYAAIREFFMTVPPEFRAQSEAGKQRAHIVVLGAPGQRAADDRLIEECNERFERDFPGRSLLWLGDGEWRPKGFVLDGYWAGVPGLSHDRSGRVTVASISPGPGGTQGGDYERSWMQLYSTGADFALINSWNHFAEGTQISPSRQYGVTLVDVTRRYCAQLAARCANQVSLRRDTVPDVMMPGREYQIELLLENNGFSHLSPKQGINFEYDLESTTDPSMKVTRDAARGLGIPAGTTAPVVAYVSTQGKSEALPEGDYLLHFRVSRSKVPIFASSLWQQKIARMALPVNIGRVPALRAAIISSSLPSQMQADATYSAELRLRNDGSAAWARGQVVLMYRWLRERAEGKEDAAAWQPALASGLVRDAPPGQIVTLPVKVTAPSAPPEQTQSDDGWWVLEWGIARGEGTPVPVGQDAVRVVRWDSGLRLVRFDVQRRMEAGKQYEALVTLGNLGPSTWKANEVHVRYRWHYLDGVPAGDPQAAGSLPADTPPGNLTVVRVSIQAPPFGGTYLLALDADFEGRGLASENDGAGRAWFEPVAVTVTGGPFEPVDLSKHAGVAAVTTASRRAAGNFDGAGRSLPDEQIPPDLSVGEGGWYPCGYYSGEPGALRRVPFMFPKAERGVARCVSGAGQRIELGGSGIVRIHLIAAAVEPGVTASFNIVDASGNIATVSLPIGYWLEAPDAAEEHGFLSPYIRTATWDEPRTVYLRHYSLEVRGATALELPREPRVRILALTVEREGAGLDGAALR